MALPLITAVAYVQPARPWSKARVVRARVSTATTGGTLPTAIFIGRGQAARVTGLGVVPGGDLRSFIVGASGAAAAGHALVGADGSRPGRGATVAAQANLSVAGLGSHHLGAAFLPPLARLLGVACDAGRSEPKDLADGDEEFKLSWYWKAIGIFEEDFRPAALFQDEDLVKSFEKTADRGVAVIDKTIRTTKEIKPFSLELLDMITASKSLRKVSLQAKEGYVLASSVVEATNGVYKVIDVLCPGRPIPPYPSVVPYVVHADEISGYFRTVLGGFAALIEVAENK